MRNLCHWLVLLTAMLLPAHAYAASLTFRSEVTTNEFTAIIGGDLSPPANQIFLSQTQILDLNCSIFGSNIPPRFIRWN